MHGPLLALSYGGIGRIHVCYVGVLFVGRGRGRTFKWMICDHVGDHVVMWCDHRVVSGGSYP